MPVVRIVGGGPAGCCAAMSALARGADVELIEKSHFPRHKVCGEFLSPAIERVLDTLGLSAEFFALGPARIGRMELVFGGRRKTSLLPDTAYGLSRYQLDWLLFRTAGARGARTLRETASPAGADIVATGRTAAASRSPERLFGFKTHFTGPAHDAVELYFQRGCYVGVNAVEDGRTNVCGLAPERMLRACNFDFDVFVRQNEALAERLAPLTRAMDWLATGPVLFLRRLDETTQRLAGDALAFVDPFTGSGILNAMLTGRLAGAAAVEKQSVAAYLAECRSALAHPMEAAALIRGALRSGWADRLAPFVPGRLLFYLTRPAPGL